MARNAAVAVKARVIKTNTKAQARKLLKAEPAGVKKERKPRRWHPGTVALREIRRIQKQSHLRTEIPKAVFARCVRETGENVGKADLRWTRSAIATLQVASEMYLAEMFGDAVEIHTNEGKTTTLNRHVRLGLRLRAPNDPGISGHPTITSRHSGNMIAHRPPTNVALFGEAEYVPSIPQELTKKALPVVKTAAYRARKAADKAAQAIASAPQVAEDSDSDDESHHEEQEEKVDDDEAF